MPQRRPRLLKWSSSIGQLQNGGLLLFERSSVSKYNIECRLRMDNTKAALDQYSRRLSSGSDMLGPKSIEGQQKYISHLIEGKGGKNQLIDNINWITASISWQQLRRELESLQEQLRKQRIKDKQKQGLNQERAKSATFYQFLNQNINNERNKELWSSKLRKSVATPYKDGQEIKQMTEPKISLVK